MCGDPYEGLGYRMGQTKTIHLLADHFRERFGRVWIHPKGTRAFGKTEVPVHRVAVQGWYPDMLCLMEDDRIIAVVLEFGDADLMRGLGRAVALRDSVHSVLLAAETERLRRVRDAVLRAGVGLCLVGNGQIEIEFSSRGNEMATTLPQHADVLRELEILASRSYRRRFPSLTFEHPIHFLAPIFAIRPDLGQPKQQVAALVLERWGFPGSRTESWWNSLYGAGMLGLVTESPDETLLLTELGIRVRSSLLDRYGALDLRTMADDYQPLVDRAPDVAFVLRSLYLSEPDVDLIVSLLRCAPPEGFDMSRLMALLIQRHPNAALNLFVVAEAQNRFAAAWRQGRLAEVLRPKELKSFIHLGLVGAFKRQLIHLGFLDPSCPVWRSQESYDVARDRWRPRF